jgi:hypothetical protein
MRTRPRRRFGHTVSFTPYSIPRALKYAEFDFERSPAITLASGDIQTFTDPISGGAFTQGTAGSRPNLEATGFNGRPCALFTSDSLRNTTAVATLGWPSSGAFEIWWCGQFLGAAADAIDIMFAYPSNLSTQGVSLGTTAGASFGRRGRFSVSNGTTAPIVFTPDFPVNDRVVLRAVADGANVWIEANGVAGVSAACVPAFTGGPRNTLGGTAASTAASLQNGRTNFLAFYKPLPTQFAAGLYQHLSERRGAA